MFATTSGALLPVSALLLIHTLFLVSTLLLIHTLFILASALLMVASLMAASLMAASLVSCFSSAFISSHHRRKFSSKFSSFIFIQIYMRLWMVCIEIFFKFEHCSFKFIWG